MLHKIFSLLNKKIYKQILYYQELEINGDKEDKVFYKLYKTINNCYCSGHKS